MMLLLLPHALACVLDPGLPVNLTAHADVQPLCAGFIDASTAPYGAAGDGVQDDTVALQAALDDAYAFQLAVLLPAGRTFLVNRQLRLVQNGRPPSMRDYGFQLVGARGSTPPTIKVRTHDEFFHPIAPSLDLSSRPRNERVDERIDLLGDFT